MIESVCRKLAILRAESDYCACCGRELESPVYFCAPCTGHIGDRGEPWDRIYFALNGELCPFEEDERWPQ